MKIRWPVPGSLALPLHQEINLSEVKVEIELDDGQVYRLDEFISGVLRRLADLELQIEDKSENPV